MGFEFGYAVADPSTLVLWEGQFGDFANGAQVIIDQFIAGSEQKWNQTCDLVLLLPHGQEGQGPEHSSARLERFLTLCAENNMSVANVTTPAQYYHLLMRQMRDDVRRPLVVMSPKSLLRHPKAVSTFDEIAEGAFQPVLDDAAFAAGGADGVRRVVLASGKLVYELLAAREKAARSDVAIVRLEELYPFPGEALGRVDRALSAGRHARLRPGRAEEHGGLALRARAVPRRRRSGSGSRAASALRRPAGLRESGARLAPRLRDGAGGDRLRRPGRGGGGPGERLTARAGGVEPPLPLRDAPYFFAAASGRISRARRRAASSIAAARAWDCIRDRVGAVLAGAVPAPGLLHALRGSSRPRRKRSPRGRTRRGRSRR